MAAKTFPNKRLRRYGCGSRRRFRLGPDLRVVSTLTGRELVLILQESPVDLNKVTNFVQRSPELLSELRRISAGDRNVPAQDLIVSAGIDRLLHLAGMSHSRVLK